MTNIFERDREEFHRHSKALGGAIAPWRSAGKMHRVAATELYDQVFVFADEFIQKISRKSPKFRLFLENARFGIIANPEPNAYTWKDNGKYFVGITSGLVHLYFHTCNSMMCDNSLFSFFEEDEFNESSIFVSERSIKSNFLCENDEEIAYQIPPIPDNEFRRQMAASIFVLQIMFTIFHEIGHCLMGHHEIHGIRSPIISEMNRSNGSIDEASKNLIMEFQADNIALLLMIEHLMDDAQRMDGDSADAYFILSASIDLVFWLFSIGPIEPFKEQMQDSHPHSQYRIAYKTFRLIQIDSKIAVKSTRLAQLTDHSIAKLMIIGSMRISGDWINAKLSPDDWSIFRSTEILVGASQEIAKLLFSQSERSIARFMPHLKMDVVGEVLSKFYGTRTKRPRTKASTPRRRKST